MFLVLRRPLYAQGASGKVGGVELVEVKLLGFLCVLSGWIAGDQATYLIGEI